MHLRLAVILPGWPHQPSGGHAAIYSHMNWLAEWGHSVSIHFARRLLWEDPQWSSRPRWRSIRVARDLQRYLQDGRRVRWTSLHPSIGVHCYLNVPKLPQVDVIIATAAQTAPFAARVAQRERAQAIHFIQSWEDWAVGGQAWDRILALPTRKIAIAPWLQDRIEQNNFASSLVVNAISIPPTVDALHELSAVGKPRVITQISTNPVKRTDIAAQVYSLLRQTPHPPELVTFGDPSASSSFPPAVQHLGFISRDRAFAEIAKSSVYLCTSDVEGWHLPPAEATLLGTPVVSTQIGGVTAYLRPTEAYFSPPGDAVLLADNVRRVLSNPERAQAALMPAQERLRLYTPEKAAGEFLHAIT